MQKAVFLIMRLKLKLQSMDIDIFQSPHYNEDFISVTDNDTVSMSIVSLFEIFGLII